MQLIFNQSLRQLNALILREKITNRLFEVLGTHIKTENKQTINRHVTFDAHQTDELLTRNLHTLSQQEERTNLTI